MDWVFLLIAWVIPLLMLAWVANRIDRAVHALESIAASLKHRQATDHDAAGVRLDGGQ